MTSTDNPASIIMDDDLSVVAAFVQNNYTVAVDVVGGGSVTLNASGPYHYGDVVGLTAVPTVGWSFGGWSGNLTGLTNPANVTISGNMIVNATFTQDAYSLSVVKVGSGSVSLSSNGPYHYGDAVQLTATASSGWSFSGWSGALTGSASAGSLTIDGDMSVTATFAQNEYSLAVAVVGNGSVVRSKSGPYHLGDTVLLTATASAGWNFSGWSGALTGSRTPSTITIDGNKVVTATFTVLPLTVSVTSSGINLTVGESVMFNALVSGGVAPYSYQWYLNGAAVTGATGAAWTFMPETNGVYVVYLKAVDSSDMQVQSNNVTIYEGTEEANTTPNLFLILFIAIVVVIVILGGLVYFKRQSISKQIKR